MRLVTFNILHGRSLADDRVVPARLAEAVRRLRPDVLAMQEVDRDQPRSGRADLTQVAAEAMAAVDSRFVAAIAGTPGEVWTAATGREQPGAAAYGIALLSRVPVRQWQIVRLGALPMHAPAFVSGRRMPILVRDEPRVAVAAALDSITVATTHLSFVQGWNLWQLRRLLRRIGGMPGPRVVMGDLNLPAAAVCRITGWRGLVDGATFPAGDPRLQLDHVLTDNDSVRASATEVVELPLSDHRAMVADIG